MRLDISNGFGRQEREKGYIAQRIIICRYRPFRFSLETLDDDISRRRSIILPMGEAIDNANCRAPQQEIGLTNVYGSAESAMRARTDLTPFL